MSAEVLPEAKHGRGHHLGVVEVFLRPIEDDPFHHLSNAGRRDMGLRLSKWGDFPGFRMNRTSAAFRE